jgi:hypothetical protein
MRIKHFSVSSLSTFLSKSNISYCTSIHVISASNLFQIYKTNRTRASKHY